MESPELIKELQSRGYMPLSDEEKRAVHTKLCKGYLFYRKHSWGAACYCTRCMTRFNARYDSENEDMYKTARLISHNESIRCPECDKYVTAKAEGYGRKNLYKKDYVSYWNASPDGSTVYITCGIVVDYRFGKPYYDNRGRNLSVDELEVEYHGSEWETLWAARITPGEVHSVRRSPYYYGLADLTEETVPKEPWTHCGCYFGVEYFSDNCLNYDVLENTFLKYVYRFCKYRPEVLSLDVGGTHIWKIIKFYEYAALYPSVEMLIKSGFAGAVREIVDENLRCKRLVNLKGGNPREIFRLDGNRTAALMRFAKNIYGQKSSVGALWSDHIITVMKIWRYLLKYDKKAAVETAFEIFKSNGGYRADVTETLEYCAKMTALSPSAVCRYVLKRGISPNLYRDYINECSELGYNLNDELIRRPNKFEAMHERSSAALRIFKAERLRKEKERTDSEYRRKFYDKYADRFEYSDADYMMVVPKGAEDIIREGAEQRNCVAGYAERRLKGSTIILFLRRTAEPDKSFGTIEIETTQNGNKYYFAQAYAAGNTHLPADAQKWLDNWLARVNAEKAETAVRVQVTA